MSKQQNGTSEEMRAMHDELVASGFLEVVTLPGNRSQLTFPRGENCEEVQEYLEAVRVRAGDKPQFARFAVSSAPRWGHCK